MRDVVSLLAMDRTTLTANLKPLERRGLVRIDADPDDRRSRLIVLTEAGRQLLTAAVPIWRSTHKELDALTTASRRETLLADLLALS